ncbi:hypothetical protein C4901_01500 [Acidiferrobacter sp. SPIII_3]|nr:transposase [Acidiferrobacter sp. SPIII_3]AWP22189.1 hypothetical protein C4901_01500 [Acidiferrobacter sp. SPIII_3]
MRDLFGCETTVTLYDLTNTYFEGAAAANPQAARGRSKEKRSDCPLVTLGLVLDGSGFVRRSETFAGHAAEVQTLEAMLIGLDAPRGSLIVMDAGIAAEANLTWLVAHGYRYLVVSRKRTRHFEAAHAITIETASQQAVQIQKVTSDDGQEVQLHCYSTGRQAKEAAIARRFCARLETGLHKLAEGLNTPRGEKRLAKLQERMGRLKEKSRVGQHYAITLTADESGEKALSLTWVKQPIGGTLLTYPGVQCLRTNETQWDAERLWHTYILFGPGGGVSLPQIRAGAAAHLSPPRSACRWASVHQRACLSAGPDIAATTEGKGHPRKLVGSARDPLGSTSCHGQLSKARWTRAPCMRKSTVAEPELKTML